MTVSRAATRVETVTTIAACRSALAPHREAGRRIALVPTMGALHDGHLALIDRARGAADRVVLSIFVNPLQFGPGEDYRAYPRDLERDRALAAGRGVDLIFAPPTEELVPRPPRAFVGMRGIVDRYEGVARPGHFEGVLTIVAKLLHVVQPDVAVFGRKDAQQAAAVRRMVADLDLPVGILLVPTVREPDGLAASSRNAFLSPEERIHALALPRALERAREGYAGGERDGGKIEAAMQEVLAAAPGVAVDYAAVVDPERFQPLERIAGPALAIVAARVGRTRLIDNMPLAADG